MRETKEIFVNARNVRKSILPVKIMLLSLLRGKEQEKMAYTMLNTKRQELWEWEEEGVRSRGPPQGLFTTHTTDSQNEAETTLAERLSP